MPHHITHEHVQAWLDAYERAWESYDRDQIAALFTDDAEYRWHPADEPTVGRDAIVEAWLAPENRDVEDTYQGDYKAFVGAGRRAVGIGTSTYWSDASRQKQERIYYNSWLLEFGEDGKCSSFVEYWMVPRKASS